MKFRPPDSRNTQDIVPPPEAYYYPQDEVSLVDLWKVLASKKKIIFITMAISVVLAAVYALTQPKVYQSEVSFVPPSAIDIQPFNTADMAGFTGFTTEELYRRFLSAASSNTIHRKVFDEQEIAYVMGGKGSDDSEASFQGFTKSLQLHTPNKDQGTDYTQPASLSLEGTKPELISRYLNAVVKESNNQVIAETATVVQKKIDDRLNQIANDIARIRDLAARQRQDEIARIEERDDIKRQQILDEIAAARDKAEKERIAEISRLQEEDSIKRQELLDKITTLREHASLKRKAEMARLEEADNIKREQIQDTINSLRSNAKAKRLDRIKALQEAANIAQEVELKEDATAAAQNNIQQNQSATYDFGWKNMPVYLLGEKALRAEIEGLKSRSSDDPFIPNLRSLQDQLKQLEVNEQVEALKARHDNNPFIAELPELLDQVKQLEKNERIEALKARKSNDPFIPELVELEAQLQLLAKNRPLEKLKSRVNDDPFIPELRKLELEELKLRSLALDASQASSVSIDQFAYPANAPVKPRRDLILTLGVILGLMLGVLAAFFANFIEKVRKSGDKLEDNQQIPNDLGNNTDRKMSQPRVVAN